MMRATSLVVLIGCVVGCAPHTPIPAREPTTAAVDPQRIFVEPNAKDPTQYVLRNGDNHAISEREFRRMYREVTGQSDLDEDARRRAERKMPVLIGLGLGSTAVGGGGLAVIAATKTPICRHDAQGDPEPGCTKAATGIVMLGVIVAAGIYAVGCGVAKGADCLLDGNVGVGGSELSRQAAEHYVRLYNEALACPEHTNVREEPKSLARRHAIDVQLTPFGASGTF